MSICNILYQTDARKSSTGVHYHELLGIFGVC